MYVYIYIESNMMYFVGGKNSKVYHNASMYLNIFQAATLPQEEVHRLVDFGHKIRATRWDGAR